MIYNVVPRLGEILKERNMTQNQLAQMTGIPQGTISKFDKNERHQDVHLVAISNALNIAIEDLFYIEKRGTQRTTQSNSSQRDSDDMLVIDINLPDKE